MYSALLPSYLIDFLGKDKACPQQRKYTLIWKVICFIGLSMKFRKASCWILFRSLSSVGGGYIWHLFGNFGDNSIQPKLKQYLNSPHALPQTRSKWNSNLIFPESYSKKFMQCIQSSWEWRLSFLQWWFCISKHETALPNFLFNISPNLTICKWN